MDDSLVPPQEGEDWLDNVLRAEGRERSAAYLSDDGFTARVLGVLPATAHLPAWRKPLVALLWSVLAVASLIALRGLADDLFRAVAGLVFGHRLSLAGIATTIALLGAATWTALVYAARTD